MDLKWNKILTDPALWLLLGLNVFLVYRYEQTPEIFTTLIWLYWSQSILFGYFTYYTMKSSIKLNLAALKQDGGADKPAVTSDQANAWMFIMMFNFFHIVYFIFLYSLFNTAKFDWDFYWKFLALFFVFQLISFIKYKVQKPPRPVNVTKMTSGSFLRVVPMHLCILIPAFLGMSNLTIFLVLKVITDMIMFVLTTGYYKKPDLEAGNSILNIESDFSN